jgi:hypothetical protein
MKKLLSIVAALSLTVGSAKSDNYYVPPVGGGGGSGGTVSSVGLQGDGTIFNTVVSNSPITSTGILGPLTRVNAAAWSVLGNASGSSAPPTYVGCQLAAGTGLAITNSGNLLNSPTVSLSVPVLPVNGGTGKTSAPALNQILVGNNSSGYDLVNIVAGTNTSISNTGGNLTINNSTVSGADASATYLTKSNNVSSLPNSCVLTAGSNITLTPGTNTLTISSSGGGGGSGLSFGGDGSAGAFSSDTSPTPGPGNSQNFTTFTVVNGDPFQTQSSVVINATGAVEIDDVLSAHSQAGGPSQGTAGGSASQANTFGTGSTAAGGGGGGGNGGHGGQGGSGSTGTDCPFAATGGLPGGIANFTAFSGSAGGMAGSVSSNNNPTNPGGGSIIIAAVGAVNISGTGSLVGDAQAAAGTAGGGGGSGGTIAIYSQDSINVDGTLSSQGAAGEPGSDPTGTGGVGDGGPGGGGWIVLVAPSLTGAGIGSANVSGATATTGNPNSHIPASNAESGQVMQVTATPTLPLCQLLPKYINTYGAISDAQGKTITSPTARIHKVSGREFISFMAANEAKNSTEFAKICNNLTNEESDNTVVVGDFIPNTDG